MYHSLRLKIFVVADWGCETLYVFLGRRKQGKMGMLSSLLNIPLNIPQNTIILTLL